MKFLPTPKRWALLAARIAWPVLGLILGVRWHDHTYWALAGIFMAVWAVLEMVARRRPTVRIGSKPPTA